MKSNYSGNPIFALALVALFVPFASLGLMSVSAASADSTSEAKSLQYDLFDVQEFFWMRRNAREDVIAPVIPSTPAVEEQVKPCDPVPVKEEPKTDDTLTFGELTSQQQEDLRLQLRVGGCPQGVLPGYQALCELMLKNQESKQSLEGLVNPNQ